MYTVLLSRRAQKDLRGLAPKQRSKVVAAVEALAEDPFPPGRKKLKGQRGDYWRIRVGDYRVLYELEQEALVVLVLRALDRKEAYYPSRYEHHHQHRAAAPAARRHAQPRQLRA